MKTGIILNAEAFGFGPSAFIAQLFTLLRPHFDYIAYVGEGHSLDLQKRLPYDEILEIPPGASPEYIRQLLRHHHPKYTYFFSALDFTYAQLAKEAGYQTGLYDPLTWFWNHLSPTIKNLDLYVAQRFHTTETIIQTSTHFPRNTHVVAPIVKIQEPRAPRKSVLVNFGGLANPYLNQEHLSAYAQIITQTILQPHPESKIITSQKIAARLGSGSVATTQPSEVQEYLAHCKCAIMTSGLGNIFEAAATATKTLWLPPTNDSQGQQLAILKQEESVDATLGWEEFTPGGPLNYFQNQAQVMAEIKVRLQYLITQPSAQVKFAQLLKAKLQRLQKQKKSHLPKLLTKYGTNGLPEVAGRVRAWAQIVPTPVYFKLHNLIVAFHSSEVFKFSPQNLHQLSAHVPEIQIIPPTTPHLTLKHVLSQDYKLIQSSTGVEIEAPWTQEINLDFIHLLYSMVRKYWLNQKLYPVHGACLNNYLLVGPSGSGKTSLALNLVKQGHELFSGDKTLMQLTPKQMTPLAGTKFLTVLNQDLKRWTAFKRLHQTTLGSRTIFKLPASAYSKVGDPIQHIFIVKIRPGLPTCETLTTDSALHVLFPMFLDKHREDVILGGHTLFDGTPDVAIKLTLMNYLAQVLPTISVVRLEGSAQYITQKVQELSR